ncbi:MAG: homoserine kinase [Acidimicrobiia bacterium]|nr:homoserine kinase [Acidimicrobiia bacterium]
MLTSIAVPASVANLGPGFDTLAVAVELYLRVRLVERRADGRGELIVRSSQPPVPGENGIERAYRSLAGRVPRGLPSVVVDVESEIPIGAGLGSSAAATVAGLRLFEEVGEPLPAGELLEAACGLEGHPDNAAAAIRGGLALALRREDGRVSVATLEWPGSVRFLIATPDRALSTTEARRVVPAAWSRDDAVFNLQRVARLVHAVATVDPAGLRGTLLDRWHQPARAALVPELPAALAIEDPDLLGVCLSGAGPSIVALAERGVDRIAARLEQVYRNAGTAVRIRNVGAVQPLVTAPAVASRG